MLFRSSRLCEQEGIFYAFDHSGEREAIHFFDKNDALGPVQTMDGAAVPISTGEDDTAHTEAVREFFWAHELTSSKIEMLEYDWTRPTSPTSVESQLSDQAVELPVYIPTESERSKSAVNYCCFIL